MPYCDRYHVYHVTVCPYQFVAERLTLVDVLHHMTREDLVDLRLRFVEELVQTFSSVYVHTNVQFSGIL